MLVAWKSVDGNARYSEYNEGDRKGSGYELMCAKRRFLWLSSGVSFGAIEDELVQNSEASGGEMDTNQKDHGLD